MKKNTKKVLSAAIALCLAFPFGTTAYAAEEDGEWSVIPEGYVFFVPAPQSSVTAGSGSGGSNRVQDAERIPGEMQGQEPPAIPVPETGKQEESQHKTGLGDGECAYTLEEFASIQLAEINRVREENGLPALETDPILTEMAQKRVSEYQSGHKRPDGSKWSTVFGEHDTALLPVGENWIGPWDDPYAQFQAFMDSEGHRANILKEKAKYVGIGVLWNDEENKASIIQLFAK